MTQDTTAPRNPVERNKVVPSKAYPNCSPKYFPLVWQLDPEVLTTQRVQYWRWGCLDALITLEEAKFNIANGYAYAINEQAIGALIDGLKRG